MRLFPAIVRRMLAIPTRFFWKLHQIYFKIAIYLNSTTLTMFSGGLQSLLCGLENIKSTLNWNVQSWFSFSIHSILDICIVLKIHILLSAHLAGVTSKYPEHLYLIRWIYLYHCAHISNQCHFAIFDLLGFQTLLYVAISYPDHSLFSPIPN